MNDKEMIKKKITDEMLHILRNDQISESDIDVVIETFVEKIGGWEKIYSDIQVGLNNGYSLDQQISIVKLLFNFMERNRGIRNDRTCFN